MKKIFGSFALGIAFGLSSGLAAVAYADVTAAPSGTPTQQCKGHHHGKGKKGIGKAVHAAFKSCKAAGIDGKACAQQLATYLSDFKPTQ